MSIHFPELPVAKSAMIRARVAPELKDRAETVLSKLGLTATTAITMLYQQIVVRRGLPFDVSLPNEATRRAMRDARAGRTVAARSLSELLADLDSAEPPRGSKPRRRRQGAKR